MAEKLELVWGAAPIAEELGIPAHRVNRLHEKEQLPFVRKVGGRLVAERTQMRNYFATPDPNKAA